MVGVVSNGRIYQYPDKCKEFLLINKHIKDEFSRVAKELGINKSKLIQAIYKNIIVEYRTGLLKSTDRNITISVLRSPICKR